MGPPGPAGPAGNSFALPINQSDVSGLPAALTARILTSAKGAPNGVAPLDASGKVPSANLQTSTGGGITLPIAITDVTNLDTTLNTKEIKSNKSQPNGYCPLDSNSKIPSQHMPSEFGVGAITIDSKVPVIDLISNPSLNQSSNNKIYIHGQTSVFSVILPSCEIGTSIRFVQYNTGKISFYTSFNSQTGASDQILSMGNYRSTAGIGAAVMAVKITATIWHLSGALN
jgi:hypothetical protein